MFQQLLTPVGDSLGLSFLVAILPIIAVLALLGLLRKPAWQAALAGLTLVRLTPSAFFSCVGQTIRQCWLAVITVMLIVGLAYLMNYSGLAYALGQGVASTGKLFVLLSPFLGWVAVMLFGSDTSGNALLARRTRRSPAIRHSLGHTACGRPLDGRRLGQAFGRRAWR
jgi:L-lactate permease